MVIYGFSNGFYRWNTLVQELLHPRFWDKFLIQSSFLEWKTASN
ncbi:hypothetical protein LEP1GSC016_0647 [Leptospira borgpetersenii serovar Hardjo-bovis str. Sponselee]|uniref:Uncharacterized protein n=1 Tax=Leptospira borgpetersenii serovar Hardjo-bovis str. Sponselee TaxID=1303729 RepID=M6BBQ7_LEPBO|nr:hypothetical protein LEP1GSC016_0647 [Leptospira borgpetersenii serovar Hardjo-bovis str. Sponselee]